MPKNSFMGKLVSQVDLILTLEPVPRILRLPVFLLLASCSTTRSPNDEQQAALCGLQEASDALAETETALASAQTAYEAHPNDEARTALQEAEGNRALAFRNFYYVRGVKCQDGP